MRIRSALPAPEEKMLFSPGALRALLLPLIAEQALLRLIGMADTVMVSFAGEAAVSGVSLVDMINYLFDTVFAAIATGGAVIAAQYLGSHEKEKACKCTSQLMLLSQSVAICCAIVCILARRGILSALFGSVEPDVMQASDTYLFVLAISVPFLAQYHVGAALFRTMKKTSISLWVSLVMNSINLVGNAIGVFALHAGVLGVAVPTLLSRIFAAAAMTVLLQNRRNSVRLDARELLHPAFDTLRRILRIAIPGGIENGLFALGKILVVSIVARFGTAQIAANGVAATLVTVPLLAANAVSLAIIPVVGQCVGAREYEQAEYYAKRLMRFSFVTCLVFNAALMLALPLVRQMYDVSDHVWEICRGLIILHSTTCIPLHPPSFNLPNVLRAAGDVKFTMYVGIGSMLLIRLGCAALFGITFGLQTMGVWIAMVLDWLVRSVFFEIRFRKGTWRRFRAIE